MSSNNIKNNTKEKASVKEGLNMKGELQIVTRCNETGKVLDTFIDNNVILNVGKEMMLKALTLPDVNLYTVKTLKIGSDVGDGDVLNPEPAVPELTDANLDALYTVPDNAFDIQYPTVNSVRFNAAISGTDVMANYPEVPNIVYTSAMLETFGGFGIAYKRFPGRTISALISVDITWTITIL